MRLSILLAIVAMLAAVTPIHSQPRPRPERVHAAVCVGEVGWAAPDDACASIVEVHVARARGELRPETVAQVFSAALRRPPANRRWVPGLLQATERQRPAGWPNGLAWAAWRWEALQRYEAIAAAVLSGERPPACPGCVDYGGLMDAAPRGMEEARRFVFRSCEGRARGCRPVAQIFYRRASEDQL